MEGFTIVDAGVGVIILLSAVLAYSRGFVREVLAIGGWVAAAIAAFVFAPQAQPLVQQIPVLDRFLGDSCELSMIASFAVVLALTLVVASIFIPLFASAVQRSALGGIDQALGFLFGALRGSCWSRLPSLSTSAPLRGHRSRSSTMPVPPKSFRTSRLG